MIVADEYSSEVASRLAIRATIIGPEAEGLASVEAPNSAEATSLGHIDVRMIKPQQRAAIARSGTPFRSFPNVNVRRSGRDGIVGLIFPVVPVVVLGDLTSLGWVL